MKCSILSEELLIALMSDNVTEKEDKQINTALFLFFQFISDTCVKL